MRAQETQETRETKLTLLDSNLSISISKSEIARYLPSLIEKYNINPNSLGLSGIRLDLPTAILVMSTIQQRAEQNSWNSEILADAHLTTRMALTTAGYAQAQEQMSALLTGTTGPDITNFLNQVFGEKKGAEKALTRTVAGINQVGLMRDLLRIVREERATEKRLGQLTDLQSKFLQDPRRSQALIEVLNNPTTLTNIDESITQIIPPEAINLLAQNSFFSLSDLETLSNLFDTIEEASNLESTLQTWLLQRRITDAKRVAAFGNLGRGIEAVIASLANVPAQFALAAIQDLIEGGGTTWGELRNSLAKMQKNYRETRGKQFPSPISSPPSHPSSPRSTPLFRPAFPTGIGEINSLNDDEDEE